MNYPIPMYCIHKSVEKLIAPVSTQELLFNFPTQVYLVLLCGYIQKKWDDCEVKHFYVVVQVYKL